MQMLREEREAKEREEFLESTGIVAAEEEQQEGSFAAGPGRGRRSGGRGGSMRRGARSGWD